MNHITSNISMDVRIIITVACTLLFLLSIMKDFVSILVDRRKYHSSYFQTFGGLLQKDNQLQDVVVAASLCTRETEKGPQ